MGTTSRDDAEAPEGKIVRRRFWRNDDIEARAQARLDALAAKLGKPVPLPIPMELLAEQVLGLDFLWEAIEELPGEVILAGLKAKDRLIVMNEKRKPKFAEHPGLERFTIGHEFGHWDLYTDHTTLDHPSLFTEEDGPVVYRSTPSGNLVAVLKSLWEHEEGREFLRAFAGRSDDPDEARAVNRYSSAILMPKDIIRVEAMKTNRTNWPSLYRLAERFGVSITALTVRLEQLDLLVVERKSGRLFPSKDAATGQRGLF